MTHRKLLAALVLSAAAAPAVAADLSQMFYAGASVGGALYDLGDSEDTAAAALAGALAVPGTVGSGVASDDLSLVLGAQLGYQLTRYIGVELSYRDYGTADTSWRATNGAAIQEGALEVGARGLGIGLLGYLPLGETANLFLRVDAVNLKTRVEELRVDTAVPTYVHGSSSESDIAMGLGLGLQFNFETCSSVRIEASYLEAELPGALPQNNWPIASLSVGLLKSF